MSFLSLLLLQKNRQRERPRLADQSLRTSPFRSSTTLSSVECQSLLPPVDVFSSDNTSHKQQRPILRPSFSHNAVINSPSPANWPRRIVTHGDPITTGAITGSRVNDRARPPTADVAQDNASLNHHHHPHHLNTSNIPPQAATHSNREAQSSFPGLTINPSNSHPNSYRGPGTSFTPYSDELSFHTTSYPGSHDSSYPNSPWPLETQSAIEQQPRHIAYYPAAMSNFPVCKREEPLLAPNEIPAPRPAMSYAALIGEAILLAPPPHCLYVSEIADSIKGRYPCESLVFPMSQRNLYISPQSIFASLHGALRLFRRPQLTTPRLPSESDQDLQRCAPSNVHVQSVCQAAPSVW